MLYLQLLVEFNKLKATPKILQKQKILETIFSSLNDVDLKAFIYILDDKIKQKKLTAIGSKTVKKLTLLLNTAVSTVLQETQFTDYNYGFTKENIHYITSFPLLITMLCNITGVDSRIKKEQCILYFLKQQDANVSLMLLDLLVLTPRIGIITKLLLKPLTKAKNMDYQQLLKRYNQHPSLYACLYAPHSELYGVAIKPMLLKKYQKEEIYSNYVYEHKWDGLRVHLHYHDNTFKIFSRNLSDLTKGLLPYILYHIPSLPTACILDGELCGLDFQTISQIIMRKGDKPSPVAFADTKLKLFDILVYDKQKLFSVPYTQRKSMLYMLLQQAKVPGIYVQHTPVTPQIIASVLNNTYVPNVPDTVCEGIVLKHINSLYAPNKRNHDWLKLKAEFNEADLVIIAAYRGTGVYNNLYSAFLVGATTACNRIVPVGKVGSGFDLQSLIYLTNRFSGTTQTLVDELKVIPSCIIEVKYQGIQVSTKYDSKISLRFPSFVRFREDKNIHEVTHVDSL